MGNSVIVLPYLTSSIIELVEILENSSNIPNDVDSHCDPSYNNMFYLDYGMMLLSIIIMIIFAIMTKRISFKRNVCHGRPGLALPMDMLNSHDHLIEYTLAFLSMSEDIYQAALGIKGNFYSLLPIAQFFVKLNVIIGISVISYPIFAAIYGRHLIGYIIAILVWGLYIASNLVSISFQIKCLVGTEIIPYALVVVTYTGIDLSIFFIFLWRIICHLKSRKKELNESQLLVNENLDAHFLYVKELFSNKSTKELDLNSNNRNCFGRVDCVEVKSKLKRRIYLQIKGFRIPPRLVIGLSVGLYFAYRIFMDQILDLTPIAWNIISIIDSKYSSTNTNLQNAFKIASGNYSEYTILEISSAYRYLTLFYTNLLIWCFICSVIIGLLNSVIQSYMILRNYRLQFRRITRRGFSSIIPLKHAPPPHALISGFVRYSGYQAAYILWGISVIIIIMFLLLFFLIGIVLLPFIYLENSWARFLFVRYEAVIIATFLLNIIQNIIVKYIFVKERGNVMEVNNQRAFMIYTHCAFFLNAMMGILNSIKRVIVWIFSGIFCFCRIDFSALPTYLQNCDSGYMTFIGFLYTEQYHHNPILKCFVDLLLNSTINTTKFENNLINEIDEERCQSNVYEKYKKKWHLAFTLINNPRLQLERKRNTIEYVNKINQ